MLGIIGCICFGIGDWLLGYVDPGVIGERISEIKWVLAAMTLGFVAYGLSIFFYVRAQNTLGAAKTSAYYAAAPFVGAALSFLGRIDMALGESFGVVTANISLVQSVHIVLYRKKGYYVSDFCNHWNVYFRQLCLLASVRHISGL